jgi:hypothetical protein
LIVDTFICYLSTFPTLFLLFCHTHFTHDLGNKNGSKLFFNPIFLSFFERFEGVLVRFPFVIVPRLQFNFFLGRFFFFFFCFLPQRFRMIRAKTLPKLLAQALTGGVTAAILFDAQGSMLAFSGQDINTNQMVSAIVVCFLGRQKRVRFKF